MGWQRVGHDWVTSLSLSSKPGFSQAFPLAPRFLEGIQARSACYHSPFRTVNSSPEFQGVVGRAGTRGRKAGPALALCKPQGSEGSESKYLEQRGGVEVRAGLNSHSSVSKRVLRPSH